MTHPITQLLEDIRADRGLILYYENRVLRKQIALEELCNLSDRQNDNSELPTVRDIVLKTLAADVNGATFKSIELEGMAVKRFPEYEWKISGKVGSVCSDLVDHNELQRAGYGRFRKIVAPTPKEG